MVIIKTSVPISLLDAIKYEYGPEEPFFLNGNMWFEQTPHQFNIVFNSLKSRTWFVTAFMPDIINLIKDYITQKRLGLRVNGRDRDAKEIIINLRNY